MASLSESKPSIGFYPNELSASIARWRPFNERFLGITPPNGSNDMGLIDIEKEGEKIVGLSITARCSFDKRFFAIITSLFILNLCVDFT
ncbi:hypothetical protein JT234_05560 [Helicobacter pylori]|nr:hypothetical protein [Helicobacter pylori]